MPLAMVMRVASEIRAEFYNFVEDFQKWGAEFFRRYYGPYRAFVVSNKDPDSMGRIQVHCPRALLHKDNKVWVQPMMQAAGNKHGEFWPPEPDEVVWLFFDNGDPNKPMSYLGGWYAKKEIDDDLDPGGEEPKKRGWVTPKKNKIIMDDTKDSENITLKSKDESTAVLDKKVTLTSKDKAMATLDENVELKSKDGSKTKLDKEVHLESSKGAKMDLTDIAKINGDDSAAVLDKLVKDSLSFAAAVSRMAQGGTAGGPTKQQITLASLLQSEPLVTGSADDYKSKSVKIGK